MEAYISTTSSILSSEVFASTRTPFESEDVENVTDLESDTGYKSDCLHHIRHQQSPLLFYTVFSIVFLLGIIGNGLLIVIFLCHKSMRTAPNTYILNLAVADLLTTVSCASAPLLTGTGHSLPVLCRTFQFFLETSMGVTSYTLVALSVERYYAIARPLHRKISSKRFTLSVVALIWIASISYVTEKMFMLRRGEGAQCVQMFNPTSFATAYALIDFVALYFIPLVIIALFYVLLALELYFSHRFVTKNDTASNELPSHMRARKRIAFTVLVLAAMFAIFYFPFNFLSLRLYLDSNYIKNWDISINILFCVGCLHNCFNPYVLYSLSETFREHFNKYLFFIICRNPVKVDGKAASCECSGCTKKTNGLKTCTSQTSKI